MFKKKNVEPEEKKEDEKVSYLQRIEHFNWSKFFKVGLGGICLAWNSILSIAFLAMFNPIFLLFIGSTFICARYLRLVLIEEWLLY